MKALSVAAAQAVSVRGEVDANLVHHCQLAELAIAEAVAVVVFPELSLTGYELDLAEELAFSAQDKRLRPLVDVADASGTILIVGAPVRLSSGLHIGAFVLEPGRTPRVYTKQYLGAGEEAVFLAGTLDPTVELGDERAAVAICADINHPAHAEAAAKRGAGLYLAGVVVSPEAYQADTRRLAGYAARHSMTVVMANAAGPSTGYESAGGSAVWSNSGALVARLEGVGAGLVVARRSGRTWSGKAMRL